MYDWDTDDYTAAQRTAYEAIRQRHPTLVTKGFGCYAGWLPILGRFFDEVASAKAAAPEVSFDLLQVKEKYGALSIHYVVPRNTQVAREDDARRRIGGAYERAWKEANKTCDV
ncbi:hypothetical protein ACFSQT_14175 [Mesorhizobium calcicola]|uniref:Uncharacterized protein n=1 Tax=Mesorhizobium calcicola TaxID=1300310 RepID=A0ABW4WE93_9HYPH